MVAFKRRYIYIFFYLKLDIDGFTYFEFQFLFKHASSKLELLQSFLQYIYILLISLSYAAHMSLSLSCEVLSSSWLIRNSIENNTLLIEAKKIWKCIYEKTWLLSQRGRVTKQRQGTTSLERGKETLTFTITENGIILVFCFALKVKKKNPIYLLVQKENKRGKVNKPLVSLLVVHFSQPNSLCVLTTFFKRVKSP